MGCFVSGWMFESPGSGIGLKCGGNQIPRCYHDPGFPEMK